MRVLRYRNLRLEIQQLKRVQQTRQMQKIPMQQELPRRNKDRRKQLWD